MDINDDLHAEHTDPRTPQQRIGDLLDELAAEWEAERRGEPAPEKSRREIVRRVTAWGSGPVDD